MIAFASLFLGLVVGLEPVELLVSDNVTAVEMRLDGVNVATLEREPWSHTFDFGSELRPHELMAIAYDSDRREVGRASQWINLPRPPAEASVVLAGGDKGRGVTAHLSWESVVAAEPAKVDVFFDGRQLSVRDPRRIRLPTHDPEQLHFLRAELDFSRNVTTVLEMVFGGSYADRLNVQLTALPIALSRGTELPPATELSGDFLAGERKLEVVAAERGPAEIVLVRDEGVRKVLNRIGRTNEKTLRRHARLGLKGAAAKSLRFKMSSPKDHQIRFLWPFSERQKQERLNFEVLIPSQTFTARDGGFYWLLTEYSPPAEVVTDQRLTDAVAVAGLLAAGRNRRRAVVLVLGPDAEDVSSFRPQTVRHYLKQLRVPLFVWSPEEPSPQLSESWGSVVDISSLNKLEQAVKNLHRDLAQQRIVWIPGVYSPADISISANLGATGALRLVE